MGKLMTCMATLLIVGCAVAAEQESSLVVHYSFDEGSGSVVRDSSGHGNNGVIHGDAKWVKAEAFNALSFNGKDTYVECPPGDAFDFSKGGALALWCRPESIQGGMISWHTGSRWSDERLVLSYMTWHDSRLIGVLSDGETMHAMREPLPAGQWAYLVLSFDGGTMELYVNGEKRDSIAQVVPPLVKDVPLRVGLSEGLGTAHFHGQIGDVQIHNRALSAKSIAERYRREASVYGVKPVLKMSVTPNLHAAQDRLVVDADLMKMGSLPAGSTINIGLCDMDGNPKGSARVHVPAGGTTVSATLKTDRLLAGMHRIEATALSPAGEQIGEAAVVKWHFPKAAQLAGASPGRKILNNLVTELVHRQDLAAQPYHEIPFLSPRHGWLFVSVATHAGTKGEIAVSLDSDKADAVLNRREGEPESKETMRFVPAGQHKLRIWCEG
ncbi:MAG: LamG domain-containing protein, partial [Pseudomonadota bacterium]